MVAIAPRAEARITTSSVHPSRYANTPPERGNAPASSATVSAPHTAMTTPSTQQNSIGPGNCSCAATVAGTRKIPLPMVIPTDKATIWAKLTERGMRSPHSSATSESRRDELDPVMHRQRRAAAQVRKAADVGGGDELRGTRLERNHLGMQQPCGKLRLQQRVSARRAAAAAAVGDFGKTETGCREQRLDDSRHSQRVLQGAGRVKGHAQRRALPRGGAGRGERRLQCRAVRGEQLADVPGEHADARGP